MADTRSDGQTSHSNERKNTNRTRKPPLLRDHPNTPPAPEGGGVPSALRPAPKTDPPQVFDQVQNVQALWRDAAKVERRLGLFCCPDDGSGRLMDPHGQCTLELARGPAADWALIAVLDGKAADGQPLVGGTEVRATALIVPTRRCALVIEYHRTKNNFVAAYPVCLSRYRAAVQKLSDVASVTNWGKTHGLLLYSMGGKPQHFAAESAEFRERTAAFRRTRIHAIRRAQQAVDRLMQHVVAERAASGCRTACFGCVANMVDRYETAALIAAAGVSSQPRRLEDLPTAWWLAFELYWETRAQTGPFSRAESGRLVDPSLDLLGYDN